MQVRRLPGSGDMIADLKVPGRSLPGFNMPRYLYCCPRDPRCIVHVFETASAPIAPTEKLAPKCSTEESGKSKTSRHIDNRKILIVTLHRERYKSRIRKRLSIIDYARLIRDLQLRNLQTANRNICQKINKSTLT